MLSDLGADGLFEGQIYFFCTILCINGGHYPTGTDGGRAGSIRTAGLRIKEGSAGRYCPGGLEIKSGMQYVGARHGREPFDGGQAYYSGFKGWEGIADASAQTWRNQRWQRRITVAVRGGDKRVKGTNGAEAVGDF